MKYPLFFAFLFSVGTTFFGQQLTNKATYSFYENKGQIIDQDGRENLNVAYLFQSNGLNVQIKKEGFSYDVYEVKKTLRKTSKKKEITFSQKDKKREEYNYKFQYHRVDIDFVGANKNPEIIAEGLSPDYENYYNIPNRPKGVEKVHRYEKITYQNLYSNIDLVFFKPEDTLKPIEYNFIVNPGGKISDIQLKFKGAKINLKDGKLCMNLRFGEMQENIPHSWEENGAAKNTIDVEFTDLGNGIFGFVSEKNVSDKTMVIDPVPTRMWATYNYGGSYNHEQKIIRTDSSDNVFTTSNIYFDANIATAGAFQTTGFALDEYACLTKFNSNGTRNWATWIGNANSIYTNGIISSTIYDFQINTMGDIYIVGIASDDGRSTKNNITTPGSHKEFVTSVQREGMIMKFNNSGSRIWGTYFGGNGYDDIYSLSLDLNEDLFFGGKAESTTGIATSNGYIPALITGRNNGFFAKFTKDGTQVYGSYLLGNVYHTAVDSDNNYLISSYVIDFWNSNEGTPGTHQPNLIGQSNSLIIKFDSNFNKKWGTYYGGVGLFPTNSNNFIFGLATDINRNIYIAGNTTADMNIATPGAHKSNFGGTDSDIFIAKLDENGNRIWGTYYGANTGFSDKVKDLFVKPDGSIYIVGESRNSTDIATPNAYIPTNTYLLTNQSIYDGYFSKFNTNGSLIWGSYYTISYSISVKNNNIYLFGNGKERMSTPGTFMPNPLLHANFLISKFRDCQNNVYASSNTSVCIGANINLTASGGTNYFWTGPNGFSSTLQNPIIPNASVSNNGTYICTISGTGDCDGSYSVVVKVEDKTAPVPNVANLPLITGNCKTVISTIPNATDNCAGNIVASTTDPLQYSLPGNYIIQWKYDDRNGNISTQNQNVTIVSEPLPSGNASQNFCQINNPKISDLQITGTSIKWYDATGNLLNANTLLVDGAKYYASQTLNGCESAKTEITVTVNDPNPPTGNASQTFCSAQMPKISDILVTGQNIKWFDVAGNFLPTTTLLLDGKTYFASQTVNGCESTQKLAVTASVKNGGIPANDYAMAICNPTTANTKIENLDDYKDNLIVNPNIYIFEFFDVNNQVISDPSNVTLNLGANIFNVKIANNLGCFEFVKLTLTLDPKPKIDLPESIEFCNGQSVTLDAGTNGLISYEWTKTDDPKVISNSQILVVSTPGNYILKVENAFGCQNSTIIKVTQSILAKIIGVQIVNNTATVLLSETGNFEFSLDQISWQNSNIFTNLKNGNYAVHIRTKSGCIIGSENFSIFTVANVFTPDADGINDTWKISGLENYPGSEIKIFDRFGTPVLDKVSSSTFEWDGTFNSRKLPSGNYWYVIKVTDGRLLQGWLLLKNRN